MKKILIATLLFSFIGVSCKKYSNPESLETEKKYASLVEVKKVLMEKIIYAAKTIPEFKKTVENECLKQADGDYDVTLEKIIQIDRQTPILPSSSRNSIISLVQQMKDFRPIETPILFVPVMESRDPKEKVKAQNNVIKTNTTNVNNPQNYITIVDQDNEIGKFLEANSKRSNGTNSNLSAPLNGSCNGPGYGYYAGYIIDNGGSLTFSNCINETLAWETDVWVLGYSENVSPENRIASSFDGYYGGYTGGGSVRMIPDKHVERIQGRTEYGGRIQVTNLSAIEPWVRGKPEFKHFVYSSTGTLIHEHGFGKLKRSHFNGNDWISLRCTIGNWNTSAWGDITYERWIEENSGSSVSLTQTISYTANGVTNTAVISSPAKANDSNLGLANVQFTDQTAWQPPLQIGVYSTFKYTYQNMNMQREDY